MDQDPGDDGVLVPFFGYETLTAAGASCTGSYARCAYYFVTIHYNPFSEKYEIEAHPPIYVERTDDKKRDIAVTTTRLNEFIEDYIRRYPEDWFWLHNRWKWTRRFYGEQIDTPPDVFQ